MKEEPLITDNTFNIRTQIQFGKFSWLLRKYYNGQEEKPDINILVREINDLYVPGCLRDDYQLNDIISQYKNPVNLDTIASAVDTMLTTAESYAEKPVNPPYFSTSNIIPLLLFDIYEKRDCYNELNHNSYNFSISENDTFHNDVLKAYKLFPFKFKSYKYLKPEPQIKENFEIAFSPNIKLKELFILLKLFKRMGSKYVTPCKFKAESNVLLSIGYKHKRLEEIYDKQASFKKEYSTCSLDNLAQSYKKINDFKMFAEALPIERILELDYVSSMDNLLRNFKLLKYRKKKVVTNYLFEEDDSDYRSYDLTEDDYRDMYRGAFDGNPEGEWNID